jgi:hypothetical protein
METTNGKRLLRLVTTHEPAGSGTCAREGLDQPPGSVRSLRDPDLPDLTIRELRTLAVAHYNRDVPRPDYYSYDGYTGPDAFLDTISVNYVLHELTSYETIIGRLRVLTRRLSVLGGALEKIESAGIMRYPWIDRGAWLNDGACRPPGPGEPGGGRRLRAVKGEQNDGYQRQGKGKGQR